VDARACTHKAGSITRYKRSAIGHRLARRHSGVIAPAMRRTSHVHRRVLQQRDYYVRQAGERYLARPRNIAGRRDTRCISHVRAFGACARCTRGKPASRVIEPACRGSFNQHDLIEVITPSRGLRIIANTVALSHHVRRRALRDRASAGSNGPAVDGSSHRRRRLITSASLHVRCAGHPGRGKGSEGRGPGGL